MPSIKELLEEREALHRRLAALDRDLEQASAAGDTREQADRPAGEHAHPEAASWNRDKEVAELRNRLARSEQDAQIMRERLATAGIDLESSQLDRFHLGEELRASMEALLATAAKLEQANATLGQRVAERTAELTAAVEALSERDQRLHLAQVAAGAGMWDWDIARGTAVCSAEYYALYGLSPGDVEPSYENWLSFMLPEDRPAAEAAVRNAMQPGGGELSTEFRIRHPQRGIRWIAGRGQVLKRDAEGRAQRLTGLIFDITDTKRLEDELRRAKVEAERANRAKTQFLASVSHDLRQPIQAAALYAELLRRQLGESRAAETVGLLQGSIASLHSMLNGLLDLSRLEAGVIRPEVIDFDPDPLLFRLATDFTVEARAMGVELRFRPCGLPITTDPHLLDRILRNLLSNAIKHGAAGEDGGAVLVACRRRDGHALFQVWDNGTGIPPEHLDVIFEEFRQLNNPERNATKGFGLGLSIVSGMARLLGLRVAVRSAVGRGTVFTVAVPLAETAVAALPVGEAPVRDAPGAVPDFAGRLALVVEDDDAVLRGLRMLLESWGAQVVTARSPDDLAPKLDRMPADPCVLIADYRLPGGTTGRAVVEMVRHRWAVPAIIITGDTAPERLREVKSLDCRLMHKPIEPRELAEALADVMRAEPAHPVRG